MPAFHHPMSDEANDAKFFKQDTCKPDERARWVGPGGGPTAFYTTWSFYAIIATVLFSCIALPILHMVPKAARSKPISIIILALIVGFAANSIGVAITAQMLLSFNWKPLDPTTEIAVAEKWAKNLTTTNIKVHLVPAAISLLLLAAVITVPWCQKKTILWISSIVIPTLFFGIWSCVPVPFEKGSIKKTTIFNKAARVYNHPSALIMLSLPAAVISAAALYVYAMRGEVPDIRRFTDFRSN